MNGKPTSTGTPLEQFLERAKRKGSSMCLRAEGDIKILGHLHLQSLVPGTSLLLDGAKLRDGLPSAGTSVALTLVLGDEVITLHTTMMEPVARERGGRRAPLLQLAWPTVPMEVHPRREVRVATPDLPPLEAVIEVQGRTCPAKVLNLTELGIGLGLTEPLELDPHAFVDIRTSLPGAPEFRVRGEVRHTQTIPGDELPTRVGLILVDLGPEAREALSGFVQARRMDRTYVMRGY
jgi:hypothetical protein